LIAGSTGIVGGNLAALLAEEGWKIERFDSSDWRRSDASSVLFFRGL
jgi:nucleoside-diphosphate-sugar epimerase